MAKKNYEKMIDQLKFLQQSGIDNTYFVNLNLGVCYYKMKRYASALYYLDKASYLKPSFEVYDYLFKINSELGTLKKLKYYVDILSNFRNQENYMKLKVNINKALKYETEKIGKFTVKKLVTTKPIINIRPVVAYYTGYSGAFNGKNYKERDAVWGSEIAAIKLCESLAKIGYECHIFCKCDEELEWKGVHYHSSKRYQNFQYSRKIDYLIISRYLHFFVENPIDVGKIIFLMHDARGHNHWLRTQFPNYGNSLYHNLLDKIDNIVCVSDWQVDNFHRFTKFDKNLFTVISNGINSHMFDDSHKYFNKKQENRIIYCSDPDRGLKYIVNHFDKIRKDFGNATLDIYFSHISEEIQEKIKDLSYINFRGKLPNDKLIKELKKSDYWIYPNFASHETFCIAALEAMGSGCIPITRKFSGLITTVGDMGHLVDREKTPDIFFQETVDFMKKMNNNLKEKNTMRKKCIKRAKMFDWDNVAKQWSEKIFN